MARAAIVLLLLIGALALRQSAPAHGGPDQAGTISRAERDAGLTFDPSVDRESRAMIERAIADARPEAQRLIAVVDGLTDVRVAFPERHALGTTHPQGGRFDVVLDLGDTLRQTGPRGVDRLVLHELGHVVDFALVSPQLDAQLDAKIPVGVPCPAGTPLGACAPREERFAETFAKWAMGNDLGSNLYIGYGVPPPSVGFDAWAAPLIPLAAAGAP